MYDTSTAADDYCCYYDRGCKLKATAYSYFLCVVWVGSVRGLACVGLIARARVWWLKARFGVCVKVEEMSRVRVESEREREREREICDTRKMETTRLQHTHTHTHTHTKCCSERKQVNACVLYVVCTPAAVQLVSITSRKK